MFKVKWWKGEEFVDEVMVNKEGLVELMDELEEGDRWLVRKMKEEVVDERMRELSEVWEEMKSELKEVSGWEEVDGRW